MCSVYEKVKAAPPATATTGLSGVAATSGGLHASVASGGAVRASASNPSRSQPSRTIVADARTESTASVLRSATGTRPKWRDGVATWGARRRDPYTGTPTSSMASRSSSS